MNNLRKSVNIAIVSSFVFFCISNAFVYAEGRLYPHTIKGLFMCYALSMPFIINKLTLYVFSICLIVSVAFRHSK